GGTTSQHLDVAITEPLEAPCCFGCDTVGVVEQNDAAGSSRYQISHILLEPAVGKVYCEQWMTRSVLTFLADVQKGYLAAVGEPVSERFDFDVSGHVDPSDPVSAAASRSAAGMAREEGSLRLPPGQKALAVV